MDLNDLLLRELRGSVEFFLQYTNFDANSDGYGLTLDSTKDLKMASIAATGFTLSAWVIAAERGLLPRGQALAITRGTLHTLLNHVPHHRGFFAHFIDIKTAERFGKSEYSTIDTALCLNGVITAAAYFQDQQVSELAQQLLERVDWRFLIFEKDGQTLFHMAYNPDRGGDYVTDAPGFISQWDMAAEQKMMYLQAAGHLDAATARRLYQGFRRDKGLFEGQEIIINPGGTLFAYQFSEAWLDTAKYLDPDDVDWFNNTRLAILADRSYCMGLAQAFKTYGANSWGCSAGDSPWGYNVTGALPALVEPKPNGTVSIYGGVSSLPFAPAEATRMIEFLYLEHPQTWGKYGFFDSYNTSVVPSWYSHDVYGIDKGCSLLMVENHLSGLIWKTYTESAYIQNALKVLGFRKRSQGAQP